MIMTQLVKSTNLPNEILCNIFYKQKGLISKSALCFQEYFSKNNILEAINKGKKYLYFQDIIYLNNKTIDQQNDFDDYNYSYISNNFSSNSNDTQIYSTLKAFYISNENDIYTFKIWFTFEEDYYLNLFEFYLIWNNGNNTCYLKYNLKTNIHTNYIEDNHQDRLLLYLEDILPHMFLNIPSYNNGT